MSDTIKRVTGLLIIEAVNSNPNGDPDRESDPRQRPNGHGEISPVSFKRKLRDLLEDKDSPFFTNLPQQFQDRKEELYILESRGRDRPAVQKEMAADTSKFNQDEFLKSSFVTKYWDARLFGNTFLESGAAKGFIKTGAVQFGVGISISPISVVRYTNTNKSGVQEGKQQGMAQLAFRVVEHGVYVMPFFVNPNFAYKTGCKTEDIDLLKALIPYAYDLTKSAIRPDVRLRRAWWIEHQNILGSCPDYKLFEALTPTRKENLSDPSTSWNDYEDKTELPKEIADKVESCVDLMAR
ncbi:MAG: type I CRISPR-associated protein Cas7 [Planctomycetaceae bacterium]|jgi:Cas7 group CRISPR-associated protein Csh2|nr:type I CRISPR-associated protein Cas7 [Planctomycetaceae bacterium]